MSTPQQAIKTKQAIPTRAKQDEHRPDTKNPAPTVKTLLSEPKYRIQLDDFVTDQTRQILKALSTENFPVQAISATKEEFLERLKKYENTIESFSRITALLGKWANSKEQRGTLETIFSRLPEAHTENAGTTFWLGFRWYPLLSLVYIGGIAAISSNNYESLRTILTTKASFPHGESKPKELISKVINELYNIQLDELFKTLPAHEKHYAPRSEYMFNSLHSTIEDTLFLGTSYEQLFDRFEVMLALTFVDIHKPSGWVWGPLGRFAWKYRSRAERDNPFADLVTEARQYGETWPPLKAGFFRGSLERFNEVATKYDTELLQKLNWF